LIEVPISQTRNPRKGQKIKFLHACILTILTCILLINRIKFDSDSKFQIKYEILKNLELNKGESSHVFVKFIEKLFISPHSY